MRHINLLDPPKREVSPYTPLLQMAVPVLLVAVVSIGWAVYARHQLGVAKLRLNEIEAHIRPVREEESQLQAGMGAEQKNAALHERIDQAQAQLAARQRVQSALQRGELGSTQGFSTLMQAFARQTVSGTWLTAIVLNNSARDIMIHGQTLDPEAVARMVRKLREEPALAGRGIGTLCLLPYEKKQSGEASAPRSASRTYEFALASYSLMAEPPHAASDAASASAPVADDVPCTLVLDALNR